MIPLADILQIKDIMCYSNSPHYWTYVHRNFAFHLLNMGRLYFDFRMELHKTIYKWASEATLKIQGTALKMIRKLCKFNRQNKVGILNLKLKQIC